MQVSPVRTRTIMYATCNISVRVPRSEIWNERMALCTYARMHVCMYAQMRICVYAYLRMRLYFMACMGGEGGKHSASLYIKSFKKFL